MRTLKLRDGALMPVLGQGTWTLGENPKKRAEEIAALRAGVAAGMAVIDTAEMYGHGRSEQLVGEAIKGLDRNSIFIVSKVTPSNASRAAMRKSCDTSLKHLGVSYIDLYLLHWPGVVPLEETVAGFEELVRDGKIRRWGVSNFDVSEMKRLWRVPNGSRCATNQVLYHLASRGIEFDLLPWHQEHGVPIMAYCPIAQAGDLDSALYSNSVVAQVAARQKATVTQILLAFAIRNGDVIAIPKSSTVAHTLENAAAKDIILSEEDMRQLNVAFPPPIHKMHLDVI